MRIASGTTANRISFVAVSDSDNVTRLTGLTTWTVYRSRNGATPQAMTATVSELSATFMPGVYALLVDEDTALDPSRDTEEMTFHITHAGMTPVTRAIELYRIKITQGNTLNVEVDGDIGGNVAGSVNSVTNPVTVAGTVSANVTMISQSTAAADNLELDYTVGFNKANSTIGTCTSNTDMRGTDGALTAAAAPANFSDLAITATTGRVTVGTNIDKTGYSIAGSLTTLDDLNNLSASEVNNEVVDALKTDQYPLPGQGAVPTSLSLIDATMFLMKAWRNQSITTPTEYRLYNAGATVVEQKATVGDDGTNTTVGEVVSGP